MWTIWTEIVLQTRNRGEGGVMKAQVFAGVGKFDVTPPLGYLLQGHMVRNKPSEKAHDPLYLKVLSVRKGKEHVVLVTSDLIDFSQEFVEALRKEISGRIRLKPAQLMLAASHTHTGPFMAKSPLGDREPLPDYLSILRKTIAGGIKQAMSKERPVTVRYGKGSVNIGIVNRRKKVGSRVEMRPNPKGPVDEDVFVLSFVGKDGAPLAILLNYSCHPTTLSTQIYQVSADYPGVAQRELEKCYPGAVALFTNGCCGDVRPAIVEGDNFKDGAFEDIERMGRILAAEAVKTNERADAIDVQRIGGRLKAFDFPLDRRLTVRNKKSLEGPCRRYWCTSEAGLRWKEFWEKTLESGQTIPQTVTGELQCLKIGPVAVLGLPGEVMVEIGLKIKKKAKNVVIAGYANGSLGYIPTRQGLVEGGYEAFGFLHKGYPGPYASSMEKKLIEKAIALVRGG